MKQKKRYSASVKYRQSAIIAGYFLILGLFFSKSLHVSAAPAALVSSSSVIYEAADPNSTPLGNLVQGNTFELNERITSEDGDSWYLVTTRSGVRGYMKGEVTTDLEDLPEEVEPPNQTENRTQAPSSSSSANEEASHEPDNEADEEESTQEESSEEESTEPESSTAENALEISSNNQKKTYLMNAESNRFREQMQQTKVQEQSVQEPFLPKARIPIDFSFIFLILVLILCVLILYFSYTKVLQLFLIPNKHKGIFGSLWADKGKAKKRKKSKRSKKKKTAKEAKK